MNHSSNPILFPIESPLQQSAGLRTAAKLAAIYQVPLRIVYFTKGIIQPGIPVRKDGVIVSVKPASSKIPDGVREKLDKICTDLKIQFAGLTDCTASIHKGFIENEFFKVVKEIQPFWTVWSDYQDQSDLESVIYNLSEGRGQVDAYPLLIISESVADRFPPPTIQFYSSQIKMESEVIDFVCGVAKGFKAKAELIEVMNKVTPEDYKQAQKIETDLQVRFQGIPIDFTRISGENFHLQIFANHSGNHDFIVFDHLDKALLGLEFEGASTRNKLEASQNPILIL